MAFDLSTAAPWEEELPKFDLASAKPVKLSRPSPEERALYDPTAGMSTFDKAAAGIGKAMVDLPRSIGNLVGLVPDEEIAEARARDEALMNTGAGMAGNIGGNVAMALAPGGALKGLAAGAQALRAPQTAGTLSRVGGELLAPKSIKSALTGGAAMGAIQPATSMEERVGNIAIGAGATAAIPAAARGVQVARAAVEPFYEAGQKKILGRLYNRAAGEAAPAAQAALAGARELVPRSAPTAGQASGNAGIAALERTAAAIEPSATVAHAERAATQNAARVASLEEVAGEPGKKAFFEADRAAQAKQMYDTAYEKGIDITRNPDTGQFLSKREIAARKGEISKLLARPAIRESVKEARTLAANEGVRMTDLSGSVKGLDYVQRALGDKISKATGNEKRILTNLRERLLTTIDTLSPDYKAARLTFREMSKPINQMEVGEEIINKSVNKLTGNIQPQAYARAISDDTAARATGFKGSTLENTMAPEQLARFQAIKEDLARAFSALNAGRGPGSDTIQKLAYSNFVESAGVPTFLRNAPPTQILGNLAGRAADTIYGRANREMASRLAQSGLEPAQVAEFMRMASKPGNEKLRALVTGGGSALSRAAALSLINANQE